MVGAAKKVAACPNGVFTPTCVPVAVVAWGPTAATAREEELWMDSLLRQYNLLVDAPCLTPFSVSDAILSARRSMNRTDLLEGNTVSLRFPLATENALLVVGSKFMGTIQNNNAVEAATFPKRAYFTKAHHDFVDGILESFVCNRHVCIVGEAGCGKSTVIHEIASLVGYHVVTQHLYKDMSARDLFQRRSTDPQTGDTTWSLSPLMEAARHGHMAVLDGIDQLPPGLLSSLHEFLLDGTVTLFSQEIFVSEERYVHLKNAVFHGADDDEMGKRGIHRIHPSFRLIATARMKIPRVQLDGDGNNDTHSSTKKKKSAHESRSVPKMISASGWLSPDVVPLFNWHIMPHLTKALTVDLLKHVSQRWGDADHSTTEKRNKMIHQVVGLQQDLEEQNDTDSKIPVLSLRQVLHIIQRTKEDKMMDAEEFTRTVENALLLPIASPAIVEVVTTSMKKNGMANLEKKDAGRAKQGPTSVLRNVAAKLFPKSEHSVQFFDVRRSSNAPNNKEVRCGGPIPIFFISRRYREEEVALVPMVSKFHPNARHNDVLQWLCKSYASKQQILIVGNQGVGKNKIVDYFLMNVGLPRHYLQLHRDTTVGSLTMTPTVVHGTVVWEDSALIKAVKYGHILVVDEIDKAAVEVVNVLKGLVEDGEMHLGDGRKILRNFDDYDAEKVSSKSLEEESSKTIRMHQDFRIIALANPPGYPFHGNDFYRECGDLFSCLVLSNPDGASQVDLLLQYGPDIPIHVLRSLVAFFEDLGKLCKDGALQYPFSLRELIAIVRHLQAFPQDGIFQALNNVFHFDSADEATMDHVRRLLHVHLSPLGPQARGGSRWIQSGLAKEIELSEIPQIMSFSEEVGSSDGNGTTEELKVINMRALRSEVNRLKGAPTRVFHASAATLRNVMSNSEEEEKGVAGKQSTSPSEFNEWSSSDSVNLWKILCVMVPCPNKLQTNHEEWYSNRRFSMKTLDVISARDGTTQVLLSLTPKTEGSNEMFLVSFPQTLLSREISLHQDQRWGQMCSVVPIPLELFHEFCVPSKIVSVDSELVLLACVPSSTSSSSTARDAVSLRGVCFFSAVDVVQQLIHLPLLFYSSEEKVEKGTSSTVSESAKRLEDGFAGRGFGFVAAIRSNIVHIFHQGTFFDIVFPRLVHRFYFFSAQLAYVEIDDENITSSSREKIAPYVVKISVSESDVVHCEWIRLSLRITDGALVGFSASANTKRSSSPSSCFSLTELVGAVFSPTTRGDLVFGELQQGGGITRAADVGEVRHFELIMKGYTNSSGQGQPPDGGSSLVVNDGPFLSRVLIPSSSKVPQMFSSLRQGGGGKIGIINFKSKTIRHIVNPSSGNNSTGISQSALSPLNNFGVVVQDGGSISQFDADAERVQVNFRKWSEILDGGRSGGGLGKQPTSSELDMWYSEPRKKPSGHLKHGEEDPENTPHVGGNNWAGGTGGTDTAGLGGLVGPYRLDKGHKVHQVSPEAKKQVPQHIQDEARRMAKIALERRLQEISMSTEEDRQYNLLHRDVKGSIEQLQAMLSQIRVRDGERVWMKHQTDGVWDDSKLVEGITGETTIYKRRVELDDVLPSTAHKNNGLAKKKRLLFLLDVSASMYRFNSMDQRLERLLECAIMIMESFKGHESTLEYSIVGHSGSSDRHELVDFAAPPENKKERMRVCQQMTAVSQHCWSGDNTVEAMKKSIEWVKSSVAEDYFVFVVSDANLQQYGISPVELARIMRSDAQVKMYCIFIASFGSQAKNIQSRLPVGHGFECLDTAELPSVLRKIFRATNLLGQ